MLKRIFLALVIIFAFLIASVYIFRTNIKRYAIQTILKSFPIPNVALANVNFDETTGRLNLEEIKVKNPKGFGFQNMIEAKSVDMDISFTTKPELLLNIDKVDITEPVFYVERSRDGRWNFQEYTKKQESASYEKENAFDFIENAFAAEQEKKPQVILPRMININTGKVHFLDSFIAPGAGHRIDLSPLNGTLSLHYLPQESAYQKIRFEGSCNIAGNPSRIIKGNFETYPMKKAPSYVWEFNTYNIPLLAIKPYLDRYSPFIVSDGSFNMNSNVKAEEGMVEGNYTMELMDLQFSLDPRKSNISFLETSVKKLTLYLTNQRGNVIVDFTQKTDPSGNIRWGLGPITKRAIGLMTLDTVIEVIDAIEKNRQGGIPQEALPGDIPPEVIEIFRGIFK